MWGCVSSRSRPANNKPMTGGRLLLLAWIIQHNTKGSHSRPAALQLGPARTLLTLSHPPTRTAGKPYR